MRSVPPDGGETQPIIRIVDVLPAPFGPRKPKASPRLDVEVDAVHGHELAETLDQPAGVHQRQRCACIHHTFNLPTAAGTSAIASGRDAGGVAGGHPATAAAGIEMFEDGGTAADAAVAASLASCVAETVMTGLLGGGHAIYFDAATGRVRNLDCFVAVPGLGDEPRDAELIAARRPVRRRARPLRRRAGVVRASPDCLPGSSRSAREHGRLPWQQLVEPALALLATASISRRRMPPVSRCSRL